MNHVELREGSRVALLVPGSAAYVDLVMSLLAAGMFPIPLDPRLTSYERERILAPLRPDLVVETEDLLASMVEHTPERYRRGVPRGRPIHCTSGTTGTPKGVFSGLLDPEQAAALVAEERELWGFTDTDVNLVLSPLHHSAPLRFATGTILAGGRIVVPGPFDPATVTDAIERERPTSMFCVPTHLQRLFAHWDAVGVPDLSSFRLVAPRGRALPGRRQAPAHRGVPGGVDLGVLRLDRGPVHCVPQRGVARAPGHRGPRPPGAGAGAGRGRDHLVQRARARPLQLPRRPREDGRGLAGRR
ncbi:AMP-binding protein [Nocardioides ungokensis]|uniref:AMP-binding protein n=1 Tax=Nocardioides ungokensis TaxID=1643322 RepID=UPI0031B5B501